MDTTLQWASENADRLIAAKHESERLNVEEPAEFYDERSFEAGGDPNRQGPLAAAYRTDADLTALFAGHGLPAGTPAAGGGFVHNIQGEPRAGLVASILHPLSSRHVADASPVAPVAAATVEGQDGSDRDAAGLGPCLALAAVALAFALRRRA